MQSDTEKPIFLNDAFISYSRKDREFSAKLETALEDYKPPKELSVPLRRLEKEKGGLTRWKRATIP